jgi:hypothetical protein
MHIEYIRYLGTLIMYIHVSLNPGLKAAFSDHSYYIQKVSYNLDRILISQG